MADNTQSKLSPTALIIFGITGDLAHKKLLPSLYDLFSLGYLPETFYIVGFARRPWDNNQLVAEARQAITDEGRKIDDEVWQKFSKTLIYIQGEFQNPDGYKQLDEFLTGKEKETNSCLNRLFYFATPASDFSNIIQGLKSQNLARGCAQHNATNARVIIEKPFGHDLTSAKELNKLFLDVFSENQIYRIDHYLAKETVQNILAFRFANNLFEPIWNAEYIDHIQITAAEDIGIGTRGNFYEQTGALQDFFQNHLLQLVTAVTMQRPASLTPDDIRSQRERILEALSPIEDVAAQTIRGQYQGYQQEENVSQNSTVETFVAAKIFLDIDQFRHVPFYLRTGKKLHEKVTDITLQLKPVKDPLFSLEEPSPFPNTITLRLEPNEGISVRFFTKEPGFGNKIVPSQMDFCYRDKFGGVGQDAYARLLLDVIAGDQSLFTSSKEVEAAWQFVTPISEEWTRNGQEVITYEPGSWGPQQADDLIEKDGRKWLAQHLIVCPIHEKHTI